MFWNDIREKRARVGEMGWMPVYFVDAYANMNCVRITVYCVHNAYMQTIWWFSSRLTWRNFARKFEKEKIRDIITSFIILCMALNQCRFGCAHEGRQHIRIKRAIKAHRPWNIMAFFLVRGMSPVCHVPCKCGPPFMHTIREYMRSQHSQVSFYKFNKIYATSDKTREQCQGKVNE